MSWTFANANQSAPGQSQTHVDSDLEEIQTDALGFLSIAGETKLRLLPQPWPSERLPPPTASLLSVCPSKGLVAAAGPDSLYIASTDSVRQAYNAEAPVEDNLKPFTPQATISIPRVSQVAFSSDGSCLAIAAEEGGGLAVYDVQALMQGQQQAAFQLATNGVAVRALIPNPAPDAAQFFALVLANGQLMLANFKERSLVSGSGGTIFKEGVSCVAWSAKGKQVVAGMEDGTAAQFDHQGNVKAQIPRPPQLTSPIPLTTIYWLTNDDFLTIHTPVSGDSNDSTYHILHRDKASGTFGAQKFAGDPTPAFGTRFPSHHFISRLRSFPPGLEDVLIVSSTGSPDIGMLTKSAVALANDLPSDKIANTYTTTGMANDSRRAQLPVSTNGMDDTSPIGMVLDLTSKVTVKRPIPTEDIEETSTPLPALMLLNNEGILSTWWFVYSEAVRQKLAYPDLVHGESKNTPSMQQTPFQGNAASSTPSSAARSHGTPSFGASTFGQLSKPAFGSTSTPGFGGSTALGSKSSPWGASSTGASSFGKPSFGSSTPIAASSGNAAFGATGGIGSKSSPWGESQTSQPAGGSTFGKPSAPFGNNAASGFSGFAQLGAQAGAPAFAAASSENRPAQSPFGAFGASKSASPFANLGPNDGEKPPASPFSKLGASESDKTTSSPFSNFGANNANKTSPFSSFGQQNGKPTGSAVGPSFGSTVTLPSTTAGSFGGPSAIGAGTSAWGTPSLNKEGSGVSGEATMTDEESGSTMDHTTNNKTDTLEKPSAFGGFKMTSNFEGDGSAKEDLPKSKDAPSSFFGSTFGSALGDTSSQEPPTPVTPVKKEPGTEEPRLQDISTTPSSPPKPAPAAEEPADIKITPDDAPLPPDFTKIVKSNSDQDAPLPPDFLTSKSKKLIEDDLPPIAGSPPVDLGTESPGFSPPASSDGEIGDEDEEDGVVEEEDTGSLEEDEGWEDESAAEQEQSDDNDDQDHTPKIGQPASTTPFASRLTFPGQTSAAEEKSKTQLPSTTPVGLPKGPIFAPPTKESPRSPSPIRSVSTPAGRPALHQAPSQGLTVAPSHGHSRTSSRPSSTLQSHKPASQASTAPESADLVDDQDLRIREILESDIEPTKTLDSFIAHQDYVGHDTKPGIGGQIENVFRDVNSMIDTLGLNARSLEMFVRGNEELYKEGGRERSDLENSEDWCLVEAQDLNAMEDGIEEDLESGKVIGVREKILELSDLHQDAARLRTKTAEARKQIAARTNPGQQATQRNAPLDAETEMQQLQLRQVITKAQKLMQEAEEALSVLRADMASVPAPGATNQRATPTVEAVTNTILKMTAMIEQKSGDVDLLEAQVRRLPRGLADLRLDDGEEDVLRSSSMRGSRTLHGRVAATPPPSRRRMAADGSALGMSGMLGNRFRTPPTNRMSIMAASPSSSAYGQSVNGSARKKMVDVTPDEVKVYHSKLDQRRKVLAALKVTVEEKGTRIIRVDA